MNNIIVTSFLEVGKVSTHAKLLQSCPTLCNPMDFSSNLSPAFQQLSNYFPASIISCSLHLSVKPAQHPVSLSLPTSART